MLGNIIENGEFINMDTFICIQYYYHKTFILNLMKLNNNKKGEMILYLLAISPVVVMQSEAFEVI